MSERNIKYIFITGGVVSSLGKGIVASSLGLLLQKRGYKVTIQKLDPYINVDSGTMSPCEHGEVFVTEDGKETDLDLGNYERFLDIHTNKYNAVTTGAIYQNVINRERKGEFLGKTVQVIPHVTDEIKRNILALGDKYDNDIIIVEIGGTVGDIESTPFLEAIRQMEKDKGRENVLYIHCALIPYLETSHELKTKPAQHSVSQLTKLGIQPNILVCRTSHPITSEMIDKLSLFCNIEKEAIIESIDAPTIYEVPLLLEEENFASLVCQKLVLQDKKPLLDEWKKLVNTIHTVKEEVHIAVIAKYLSSKDAYISVDEALAHAGFFYEKKVVADFIDAEKLKLEDLKKYNGILVPGGFGKRGIEGKIKAIQYARENNIPFLGICLGLQLSIIEFARNILGFKDANSTEFNSDTNYPVISLLEEQKQVKQIGASMRLGSYKCHLKENSLAKKLYQDESILERHRHRFEFNNDYKDDFIKNGLVMSGINDKRNLLEIIELPNHPFFIASQFHPEFKSRPLRPHPLFLGLIEASIDYKKK